ncbi:hypothetical protein PO124_12535 [Bacillus licheniformis]|nr:hypothetical protein [Bacillus licheniformis]
MRNDGFLRGAGRPFQVLLGGTAPKLTAYLSKVTLLLIMNILRYSWLLDSTYWGSELFSCAEPAKLPFLEAGAWLAAGSVTLYFIYF